MSREPETPPAATAMTDLFGRPLITSSVGSALTPYAGRTIHRATDAGAEVAGRTTDQLQPESAAAADDTAVSLEQPESTVEPPPANRAAATAERDRLLGLCQSLRAAHRCPGRCVLTGELRADGLAAFRDTLDGMGGQP